MINAAERRVNLARELPALLAVLLDTTLTHLLNDVARCLQPNIQHVGVGRVNGQLSGARSALHSFISNPKASKLGVLNVGQVVLIRSLPIYTAATCSVSMVRVLWDGGQRINQTAQLPATQTVARLALVSSAPVALPLTFQDLLLLQHVDALRSTDMAVARHEAKRRLA